MSSSHCTILARFFTCRQVLINRRQMPDRRQIGARSREWQSHSVNYQRRDLRESRCVADTRKIFGMLNIWSCLRFTILLCEWVLTEIHRRWHTANERARYRAAGSSGRAFFFFFFFTKLLMVTFYFFTCSGVRSDLFYMKCFCKLKSFIIISLHSIKICSTVSGRSHFTQSPDSSFPILYNEWLSALSPILRRDIMLSSFLFPKILLSFPTVFEYYINVVLYSHHPIYFAAYLLMLFFNLYYISNLLVGTLNSMSGCF